MVNEFLRLRDDAPPGVGTRMLAHQVREAQAMGVIYLYADAEGSPHGTMNGYYTWARLGFDGYIPAAVRNRLPPDSRDAVYVLDLLERPESAAWWRRHGRTFAGTFDLREGSRSLAVLRAYTESRGIQI
jgi:hypothetical protein